MRIKFLSIILVFVLVVGMTGCFRDDNNPYSYPYFPIDTEIDTYIFRALTEERRDMRPHIEGEPSLVKELILRQAEMEAKVQAGYIEGFDIGKLVDEVVTEWHNSR